MVYMLEIHRGSNELSKKDTVVGNRIKFFYFEELSRAPLSQAKQFYKFVGLDFTAAMKRKVLSMTNGQSHKSKTDTYETTKRSSTVFQAWRNELKFNEVEEIQKMCSETLKVYGYTIFTENTLKNLTISVFN